MSLGIILHEKIDIKEAGGITVLSLQFTLCNLSPFLPNVLIPSHLLFIIHLMRMLHVISDIQKT